MALAGQARFAAMTSARRRSAGVVHTPPALARFMVRELDRQLRAHLGLPGGLADRRARIVDPACGPGAFLASVLSTLPPRDAVQRTIWGFDVDGTVISTAAELLAGPADAAGVTLSLSRRDALADLRPLGRDLRSDETLVIVGNPPWAARSSLRGSERLLDDFRRDGRGLPLRERKIGVLSDDYVRFFRWAAELCRRAPGGALLALVTNGSYLDGPVHRGMRAALCRWFDELRILDLGGSALLARPRSMTGCAMADGNVFGVRPNAAVLFAVRRAGGQEPRKGRTDYARLWGSAPRKLIVLGGGRWSSAAEGRVASGTGGLAAPAPMVPRAPHYLFRPVQQAPDDYGQWLSLAEAMPFHREGLQSNRDAALIDADRQRLLARLRAFAAGDDTSSMAPLLVPRAHYDPDQARRRLAAALDVNPRGNGFIRPIDYRPFDRRYVVTLTGLCHRPRPALLAAIDHGGPILVTVRKDRSPGPWAHFGIVTAVPDSSWHSSHSSCRTRAFPLHGPDGQPNLAPAVKATFEQHLGRGVSALEFLHYAAAVLAAPRYQRHCDGALRLDTARLPLPDGSGAFRALVAIGAELELAFRVTSACAPNARSPNASLSSESEPRAAGDDPHGTHGVERLQVGHRPAAHAGIARLQREADDWVVASLAARGRLARG